MISDLILGDLNVKPFQLSVAFQRKASNLISSANQITGFCMKFNTGLR